MLLLLLLDLLFGRDFMVNAFWGQLRVGKQVYEYYKDSLQLNQAWPKDKLSTLATSDQ